MKLPKECNNCGFLRDEECLIARKIIRNERNCPYDVTKKRIKKAWYPYLEREEVIK